MYLCLIQFVSVCATVFVSSTSSLAVSLSVFPWLCTLCNCIFIGICICIFSGLNIFSCICRCLFMCFDLYLYLFVYLFMSVYLCICSCLCIYIPSRICTVSQWTVVHISYTIYFYRIFRLYNFYV